AWCEPFSFLQRLVCDLRLRMSGDRLASDGLALISRHTNHRRHCEDWRTFASRQSGSRRRKSRVAGAMLVLRQLVGVDHTAAGKAAHHSVLTHLRHREAPLRATELAVKRDHVILSIPGVVDDDRPRL